MYTNAFLALFLDHLVGKGVKSDTTGVIDQKSKRLGLNKQISNCTTERQRYSLL